MENDKIVTRFAPSPTGKLHSGAYRTAIFAYLFARKHSGKFILRIEDTDRGRSTVENEENIIDSLQWLGLEYDEFYRQSEHVDRHREVLEQMVASGHAYISKEEAKDGSGVIKEIVRFKNPNEDVTFFDEIKGNVTMHTADLGDFVIARNIHEPLFHLAVVVDDFDEGVTHIIRGEDHVSNTPRQILIQRAIGAPTPVYAHLPLVLGADKQKLSKRKGALAMTEYREQGYLHEALLNMVAMVGWNSGTTQELFSKEELIQTFNLEQVHKSPAVFNQEKLDWLNKEYVKKMSPEELRKNIFAYLPKEFQMEKLIPIIADRIIRFTDVAEMVTRGEFDFLIQAPTYDKSKLIFKTNSKEQTDANIGAAMTALEKVPEDNFTKDSVKEVLMQIADSLPSRGELLHPVRFALSGLDKSPDPFTIAELLGKAETIARLKKAL